MPGKPIEAQLYADIEAAGGWESVWDQVANGETQTAIAEGFGVSQGFLSRVIHLDPARVRAFREAKRRYAVTLVEHTGELVKNVKENRDAIAKVREQASHARWEASKWDRELFGEDKGDVNVNVTNIAALHVDALRHRIVEGTPPLADHLRAAATAVPIGDAITAAPRAVPEPVPGEQAAASKGVTWDGTTARCWDCDRTDCPHARQEYARQAQAYAERPPTGPRLLRGLVQHGREKKASPSYTAHGKAPTPNAIAPRHVSVRAAGQRACTARRERIHAAPGSGRSRRSKTCGTEPARLSRVPFGRCPPQTALPPPR